MTATGTTPTDDPTAATSPLAHALACFATDSVVVIDPPSDGPGSWAGGPCAVAADGEIWLAYRMRRPIGQGRGYANVVARSTDGVAFETVATIDRDRFGAESLERPCLVRSTDGGWRLYLSCATPGTKHWRVELLQADTPAGLETATPVEVLPGSTDLAVKDPVIHHDGTLWHLWASCHPLTDPTATDRMDTRYAISDDGIDWHWQGTALGVRPGEWDARGVRFAAVVLDDAVPTAVYDGRATAEENWEERTGLATAPAPGPDGRYAQFTALPGGPVGSSPAGAGGMRYVTIADDPSGGRRIYAELTRPDGAHELRTAPLPPG